MENGKLPRLAAEQPGNARTGDSSGRWQRQPRCPTGRDSPGWGWCLTPTLPPWESTRGPRWCPSSVQSAFPRQPEHSLSDPGQLNPTSWLILQRAFINDLNLALSYCVSLAKKSDDRSIGMLIEEVWEGLALKGKL